jgi:Lon protease-like protein
MSAAKRRGRIAVNEWIGMPNVSNSREMPLFPLNTVLFPGMPLYLHIFEPRYKLMIGECIRESRPFGVVLISNGSEVSPNVEIHSIGTAAHITHVKPLNQGEMNIASIGQTRFRILSTHNRYAYLSAIVEDFPLADQEDVRVTPIVRRLAPMVKSYLNIFAALGEVEFKMERLPDNPEALAYLTAVVLNIPTADKQRILEMPSLAEMLGAEYSLIRREALILKHMIENGPRWRDDPNLFSPN